MKLKESRGKKCGLAAILATLLMLLVNSSGQVLLAQDSAEKESSWEIGLSGQMINRGIKWEGQTSSLKSTNLMLELRAKNLGNFINLSLFGGLSYADLGGMVFNQLPITLDYQGGNIRGVIFGAQLDKVLLSASNFNFGLMANLIAYVGLKKDFPMEGFVVPGESQAEPDWAQFSGGMFVIYEGVKEVRPFLEVTASKLWGTFKMTEKLEDLTGNQTINIKGSGLIGLGAGLRLNLFDRVFLIPRAQVYPGEKTGIGGSLSLVFGF